MGYCGLDKNSSKPKAKDRVWARDRLWANRNRLWEIEIGYGKIDEVGGLLSHTKEFFLDF